MKTSIRINVLTFLILMVFAILVRIIPHPWNFTPIVSMALFSGYFFREKIWGVGLIIAALLMGDFFFLGFYSYPVMLTVYASLTLPVFAGTFLRKVLSANSIGKSLIVLSGSALASSIFFFLTTNFMVWATGTLYSKSLSGLTECYGMALPFFQNTVLGDQLFTLTLFGIYGLVVIGKPARWNLKLTN